MFVRVYTLISTSIPQTHCLFDSRPWEKEPHQFFGFPVHIKVMYLKIIPPITHALHNIMFGFELEKNLKNSGLNTERVSFSHIQDTV